MRAQQLLETVKQLPETVRLLPETVGDTQRQNNLGDLQEELQGNTVYGCHYYIFVVGTILLQSCSKNSISYQTGGEKYAFRPNVIK